MQIFAEKCAKRANPVLYLICITELKMFLASEIIKLLSLPAILLFLAAVTAADTSGAVAKAAGAVAATETAAETGIVPAKAAEAAASAPATDIAGAAGMPAKAAETARAAAAALTDSSNNCPPGVGQFLSLNGRQYQKEAKIVIKARRRKGKG